jgi:protein SCO1/2
MVVPVPQRVRLVLIGVFACLFAAFIGVWAAAYKNAGDSTLTPDASAGFNGALRPPGARVPDFRLRDQDGRVVTPAVHAGRPAIYAFIYSHCEDVCPITVQQIRGALDQLGHDVPVIGVSVDPAGDTPASARSFLIKQHMTGRMHFLLGDRRQLRPVWKAFGIQPQTATEEHSASVVLIDDQGAQRIGFPFNQLRVDGIERDLRRLGA